MPRLAPVTSATFPSNIDHVQDGAQLFDARKIETFITGGADGRRLNMGASTGEAPNSTTNSSSYVSSRSAHFVPAHFFRDRSDQISPDRFDVAVGLRVDVGNDVERR